MISLGLGEEPGREAESLERLEEQLREAAKARNLLENGDFMWWVEGPLKRSENKAWERLLKAGEGKTADHHRGYITGIRGEVRKLQIMASKLEELEERLNGYREQPVRG